MVSACFAGTRLTKALFRVAFGSVWGWWICCGQVLCRIGLWLTKVGLQ